MTWPALIEELRGRGVEVSAEGDGVHLRPASKVSPGEMEILRAHKPAILAALTGHEPVPTPEWKYLVWPASIPGLGVRRVGPYTSCTDCEASGGESVIWTGCALDGMHLPPNEPHEPISGEFQSIPGTFVLYGATALCLAHAQQRVRTQTEPAESPAESE